MPGPLVVGDRIVVMRGGKVVAADIAAAFDRDKLVSIMGAAGPRARHDAEIASQVNKDPRSKADDVSAIYSDDLELIETIIPRHRL